MLKTKRPYYEVHFYSTGAIEEGWKPEDLGENFMLTRHSVVHLGAWIR